MFFVNLYVWFHSYLWQNWLYVHINWPFNEKNFQKRSSDDCCKNVHSQFRFADNVMPFAEILCDSDPHLTQLCSSLSLPSLQILMSALRGSTTAGRTPCALTPPAPSCASAIRATSGSMTIPAQVSFGSSGHLTGWNHVWAKVGLQSSHFVLRAAYRLRVGQIKNRFCCGAAAEMRRAM